MNTPTIDKRSPYNPLAYIFIYFALIVGVSFVFMSLFNDQTGITMYQIMSDVLGSKGSLIWGVLSVVAGCGTLVFYTTRLPWIASASAIIGVGLWLFLGFLYIQEHYWDGILAAVVPNVWFWGWYYVETKWMKKVRKDAPATKNDAWVSPLWNGSRRKRL